MSNFAYYLLWLAAGLVIIAVISAMIARHLRIRVLRRVKAAELADALNCYSEWVAAQGRCAFFQGGTPESECALQVLRAGGQQWFPELSTQAQEILAVHGRVVDFLRDQQVLRLHDPEAWLESDHDARFMELWRQHLWAVHVMLERLKALAGSRGAQQEPGTYPA